MKIKKDIFLVLSSLLYYFYCYIQVREKMRKFLIISNTVDTSQPLSLNSLTAYGRLDVICRCISSAFYLSNDFRKDVFLSIFFQKNQKIMEIDGNKVRGLNPDERAIAGVLKKVFVGKEFPGINIQSQDLDVILNDQSILLLDKNGTKLDSAISESNTFVIGDHLGFQIENKELLQNSRKISLGKTEYMSSQVITILHFLLDS